MLTVHYCHLYIPAAVPECADPPEITNGRVTFTGNSVGDTATYTCDSGFELIGVETTTCTQVDDTTIVFIPDPPSCRREYTDRITLWSGYIPFLLHK